MPRTLTDIYVVITREKVSVRVACCGVQVVLREAVEVGPIQASSGVCKVCGTPVIVESVDCPT